MTTDRIIEIFEQYGQYATGKDYALISAIAEAVSSQRTWVGLTADEKQQCIYDKQGFVLDYEDVVYAVESKLKEKNT